MRPIASSRPRIFLSAGEASGDLHGSNLVRAIHHLHPAARISCLGGALLEEAGAEVLVNNRDLAVVGLVEVGRHAGEILRAWRVLSSHILQNRPDVVVLIDFPDFNFLLARLARGLGLKVFYYISPQLWAWRTGRIRSVKRLVDRMAVILPFEKDFYGRHGVQVEYVGHPLLDVMGSAPSREEASARYRHASTTFLVGLLPGSRRSEIRLLLPLLKETASILADRVPGISFAVPVASTLDPRHLRKEFEESGLPVQVVAGDTYGVIRACDLIITASGTVTLEAAILGTPMIIFNRVSNLSYHLGRHLIRVEYIGLPNLIAGGSIVPELLQQEANPVSMAAHALAYLRQPELLDSQREALLSVQSRLGKPGVADRVAGLVLETMGIGQVEQARRRIPGGLREGVR
ncbi:MAG: lipid-A-disaccharide synthase [Syntrophobacteraceae bacterium]|nr:lipid-A-disaccharide synthase [Syntrophobacteraceae bacterium]